MGDTHAVDHSVEKIYLWIDLRSFNGAESMFSRSELMALRRKAVRRGTWFRVLTRIERATIDLTIRCVDTIRSATLTRIIAEIVEKIEYAAAGFLFRAEVGGRRLAERATELALSWGNGEASKWKDDVGFIRYLGAMSLSR